MKWNDIRNRFHKSVTKSATVKPVVPVSDIPRAVPIQQSSTINHIRRNLFVVVMVLVIIAAAVVVFLIFNRRSILGPRVDTGLSREEARMSQEFLEQLPAEPVTAQEMKEADAVLFPQPIVKPAAKK